MIPIMSAALTPAYGRDYRSQAAVIKDFVGGKDFVLQPAGRCCSIRDFASGANVSLRYRKLQEKVIYVVGDGIKGAK